ncbi:MAG: ferrous iron transport protein B [bacterium]|nr:ferrous iron transport protein B [Gammaproteobacteria bacterium]HIL97596.1 ferrous iron transport protein B [Pseudomonadales bacterium]
MKVYTVALIGNPNSGKTTLFNDLTGAHQKVGNWPGVTIEQKTGTFSLNQCQVKLVDLPGLYSLEQEFLGLDEQIARDFLESEEVDFIINIVDASNLQRNLVLTQQLLEQNHNVIVALNMLDVAKQQGAQVDSVQLSENLGIPVAPLVASKGEGIEYLNQLLDSTLGKNSKKTEDLKAAVETEPGSTSEKLVKRYHRSRQLIDGVIEVSPVEHSLTEQIDRWVLNRWLGIPFFLLMMYLMFTVAVNVGAVFIDFFDILFGAVFVDGFRLVLEQFSFPQWMIVLLADGLGGGIQLVATFIPVIGLLFLCLSILEDSGYMSRAGFVVDSLMNKLGLPGSAFVPLIVGFGCNVPSVMASRSLGRDSDRLLTIAMAPFMSCGARLTVYALFAAAFFETNGQNVVFFLYLLGIAIAVLTGLIFRKQIFSREVTPSFQEMPAYHIPVVRNILITTWFRLRSFVFRAGKTIVLVVMCLSFLNSLSMDGSFGNEDSESSALSSIGKAITPVFAPIGIKPDNWPATVGLFTGLFAKEAVVGTLDALYTVKQDGAPGGFDLIASGVEALESIVNNASDLAGGLADPLGISIGDVTNPEDAAKAQGVESGTLTNMASLFGSQFAAFCYLVFVLLYAPCVAVMGAISKEAGWRWMALIFSWSTGLAYVTSSCIYQIGTLAEHPLFSILWLVGCSVVMTVFILNLKLIGKKAIPNNIIPTVQLS